MIGLPFGLLSSLVGGGGQLAQCLNLFSFDSGDGNTQAGWLVNLAGEILKIQDGPAFKVGEYVSSGLPDPLVGLRFEVKVIQLSGDTLTGSNAGLNVWLQINGAKNWTFEDTPGESKTFDGTMEIREIAVPSNSSGVCTADIETNDLQ